MSTVTRAQAEQVLTRVIKRYDAYINGFTLPADGDEPEFRCEGLAAVDHPILRQQDGRPDLWEIVWEAGDFEWAYRFIDGGVNEEIAGTLHHKFGLSAAEAGKRATNEGVKLPKALAAKVHLEPVNNYTVGIYPA